ncbi:MAG: hypothetical protein QM703_22145 [Gemmatales bacterium]
MFHPRDGLIEGDKDVVVGVFCDEIVLVFSIQLNFSLFRAMLMFEIKRHIDRFDSIKVMKQLLHFGLYVLLMFWCHVPMPGRHNDLHTLLRDVRLVSVRHALFVSKLIPWDMFGF